MATNRPPRRSPSAPASTPAWFEAWERQPPVRRHGMVLATLLLVATWFMAPALFGDGVLIGGDIVGWKAMAQSMVAEEAATGEKPLWAVNPFGGMPGTMISYDTAIPQVDTVAKWLRALAWPLSHLVILFAGVYGLVFYLVRERLAAALSAVAFGLTTYLPILLVAGHNSKYVTLAYLPWMLWAFACALRRPGLLASLLVAAAVAVNLRAGHVQITYYGAFVMGFLWLADLVAASRAGEMRRWVSATGWLVAGGALGVLMVAQPYLAQAEYKAFTIRGAAAGADGSPGGGMGWEYAMAWSQGIAELWTLFIADAFGGTGATYWGPKSFTGGPHYVGGVVLLLAGVAVAVARTRWVAGLAAGAVLMTLFSLGAHAEWLNRPMFDHFPLFDAFRVPETWLSAVAFVLAVLAGFGAVEAVSTAEADRGRDRAVYGVAAVFVGLALVFALFGDSFFDFSKDGEAESLAQQVARQRPDLDVRDAQVQQFIGEEIGRRRAERADLFTADARRTLLFLAAGALLVVLARRRRVPAWLARAGFVVLVAADLGSVGHRYLNEDRLLPENQADRPIERYAFDDWILERQAEAGGPGRFRVLSLEGDPTVTARPAYWYATLSGYHGAKLRVWQDVLDRALFDARTGYPSTTTLRLANVRYVVSGFPIPGYAEAHTDASTGLAVYEVPDPLPRAWFVDRTERSEPGDALWARLLDGSFDPARVAIADVDVPPAPRDSTSVVRADVVEYAGDAFAFDVETDRERLLVVSETWYPAGWTASVDGSDVPIVPVNGFQRGVVVPAGAHRVDFAFAPRSHRVGVLVSGVSTAVVYGGLLILLGLAWRRRRTAAA